MLVSWLLQQVFLIWAKGESKAEKVRMRTFFPFPLSIKCK